MFRYAPVVIVGVAICAVLGGLSQSTVAGTIIKLNLGSVSPDVEYDGATFFTVDDGNAATTGDQDTAVEFTDFLETVEADITSPPGSFSMSGLAPDGSAFIFNNSLIVQNFTGGTFSLYDEANVLLLSGTLDDSALTGSIGQSVGALFTTSFGLVTGGTLQSEVADDTLVLSMNFTDVTSAGGGGFSATIIQGGFPPFIEAADLHPFTGDASVNLEAQIPEPTSVALFLAGSVLIAVRGRKCRR
jgi:hypothetical protein